MDINELQKEMGNLKAPENISSVQHSEENKSLSFIDRLKRADLKSKKTIRRFYIFYFAIAIFYFGLFILNPDPDLKLSDRINGTLLFLGILLFAIMARIKYTKLRSLRYDQSTNIFLLKALERYKFWPYEMNYVLLIVLVINVGSCRSWVVNYPVFENMILDIIAFQIVFCIAMSIGLYFGHQYWEKHKKPMVDELNNLLSETEY